MGMGPSLTPKNDHGAARLDFMKIAIELDRPFAMREIDPEMYVEMRYCWDNALLIIVDDYPLMYEVTRYGHELAGRAFKEREKLQQQSLSVEAA